MKIKARHRLNILFFGILLAFGASFGAASFAQNAESLVTEGESFGSIEIGKSTAGDVLAYYGADYELVNHQSYSYEMVYRKLGLSFYYCHNDPNKEIFVVELQSPSKAVTGKGIKLGTSTFADVFRLYGKWNETSAGFEYEGVYFHYQEMGGDDDEDDEDAPNVESDAKNTNGKAEKRASSAEKNFVTGVEDVQNSSAPTLNQANSLQINRSAEMTIESDEKKAAEKERARVEAVKKKIVRRIELVEKDGLRQCGTKFRGN